MHHQIVIVGGGNGGVSVAAQLRKALKQQDIAIIEPCRKHYYQPLWTLVGAGVFPKEVTEREEESYIPEGTTWIQDAVTEFQPDDNTVLTRDGKKVSYDFLMVAPGIQIDWDKIGKTWEYIRNFKGGNAIFNFPNTPIKCAGAPQKIMYLADDYFRKSGVRDRANVIYASAGKAIFGVKKYATSLNQEAIFERLDTGDKVVLPFEMIHVTPPMSAPDFVKQSPLANESGWVDVDKYTLQHTRYPNIFGLGDASSLPTSRTGAAIRKQAPVLVKNLIAALQGKPLTARYDGYAACPLVTGYGRLIMAEFDYDGNPQETFPFDQSKERYSMYLVKAYGLPFMYWHGILRGHL
jgi:sulfide:quinone oxidoreductase